MFFVLLGVIFINPTTSFGSVGGGGGINFDWQPFRNAAWTFIDLNYYAGWFNITTLVTATWRPYFLEVTAFAGPGVALTIVKLDPPEVYKSSYPLEETVVKFLLVFGGSVGFHLGPGSIYAGVMYSDIHGFTCNIGYKLMGPNR
jgi:hypothetical protein